MAKCRGCDQDLTRFALGASWQDHEHEANCLSSKLDSERKLIAARDELILAMERRNVELQSRLDELSKLTDHPDHKRDEIYSKAELLIAIDKLVNERNNLSSRLEHYRLALEGIVRMGSDNYGIINESAKAADFALNAPAHDHLVKSLTEPLPAERDIRDNVDLAVNKQFVVERRCSFAAEVLAEGVPSPCILREGHKGRHELEPGHYIHDDAREPLCEDCPPKGYPTDKTRCLPCPRR